MANTKIISTERYPEEEEEEEKTNANFDLSRSLFYIFRFSIGQITIASHNN